MRIARIDMNIQEENVKDDIEIFNVFGDGFDRFAFPGKQYRVTAGRGGEAILIIGSEKNAIIDCGMAYCGGDVVKNIKEKLEEEGRNTLDLAFLTHSHYDHMGALPYIRRAFPEVIVYGSAHCQEILQRPNAMVLMKKLGTAARELYRPDSKEEIPVDDLAVDIALKDGDMVSLGNETIQAIEAKGHTDCSMGFQQGCEDRIQMVREMKKEGLDADQMLERYRDRYWDPIMEQEQPIEAFLINAKNIIKAALRALDEK